MNEFEAKLDTLERAREELKSKRKTMEEAYKARKDLDKNVLLIQKK